MGNCIGLKRKKKEEEVIGHPLVSRWLANCDFSSIPDGDCAARSSTNISFDTVEVQRFEDLATTYTVFMGQELADLDGYLTATENLESEEEGVAPGRLTESTHFNVKNMDGGSVYETSDELDQCTFQDCLVTDRISIGSTQIMHTPVHQSNDDLSLEAHTDEGEDMVEELELWRVNYDSRPIRPLPTPIRKNMVSPRVKLEALVDNKGRVKRTEKVVSYLDEKRRSAQVV